jgi:putative ABC transport system substrate-binding protein
LVARLRPQRRLIALAALACTLAFTVAPAHTLPSGSEESPAEPLEVVMITWRGCEEACQGFEDYLDDIDLDTQLTIHDVDKNADLLPGLVKDIQAAQPDLLVTWGTSVTLGMLGTLEDDSGAVTDIPSVFMIVADPVGAGIVESYEGSGRPMITGTRNRVPEETQLRVLAEYRPFDRIGLVYNDTELNAVLKAEEVREVAEADGIDVVERILENGPDGDPLIEDIPAAVEDLAAADVDFIYLGSSSFLLENADLFTSSALNLGLPVASGYEAMVRESHGLISLASAYYNVGQLAGYQAEQVLSGSEPGDLEILGLNRFTVLINMETAAELGLYPPLLLLRYSEVIGEPS